MNKRKPTIETTKLGNKIKKNGRQKKNTNIKNETAELESKKTAKSEGRVNQKETIRFFFGLVILIAALFMLLSFISYLFTGAEDQILTEQKAMDGFKNYTGTLGAYCADFWINRCFGLSAYLVPLFFIVTAMKLTNAYKVRLWKWFLHCTILIIWLSVACTFFFQNFFEASDTWNFINPGGNHGIFVCSKLNQAVGTIGIFFILLLTALAYLVYVSKETVKLIRSILNPVEFFKSLFKKKGQTSVFEPSETVLSGQNENSLAENLNSLAENSNSLAEKPSDIEFNVSGAEETNEPIKKETDKIGEEITEQANENEKADLNVVNPVENEKASEKGTGALEPYDPKLDLENYQYPTLELLDKRTDDVTPIDMNEQNKNKDQIIDVLHNFGVDISSIKATVGPTITLYEITPAKGVRISKIKNLEDDIALSLSALGIRIIAPIPGKGTIGIEVPNIHPHIVSMESILNSKKFRDSNFELPIALGKTITNEVFMVDLTKMPHLLVAGATGQGKSVGLNAIITSLLYKKHPAELKFVMVDPKKVEFSIYSPIENHFLAKIADDEDEPIITDVQKVVATLKSLCCEMDMRYDLLKRAHARNIKEYNTKFKNRQLNPENGHRFMPYIVVVIDEFGDLIMTAGKEIELPIARIAQLARAVGMHMIIATQRPTTNIITGTIKANFPARMAFKVSSMIDSRTILDRPGANQLIGRGDMLFLSGSEPVRVQCAFVDTPEVERITAYIAKQQSYLGPFELPRIDADAEPTGNDDMDMTHLDPLFEDAARLIVASQQGSTSMIQRKFAIGYNRAGRLMDQLEKAGIVGPTQGSKPRDVLCIDEMDLDMKLNNLR